MRRNLIFIIIICFNINLIQGQNTDSLTRKATLFYSNGEYGMALPLLTQLIREQPENPEYYKNRGNCFLETRQPVRAIADYRQAIKLKPNYADAIYNLGNTYDRLGRTDSALYFFKNYVRIKPYDALGYTRLSIIYLDQSAGDSAIYFAQKGIEMQPGNPDGYYALAMSYLSDANYELSISTAEKGLKVDSAHYFLYHPLGLSYYFLGNFNKAYANFQKGWEIEKDGNLFSGYKSQVLLLKNTSSKVYYYDEQNSIRFNELNNDNLEHIRKKVTDSDHPWYFPSLLKKFNNNPLSMSLDEFLVFYIGYSSDPNYSSYFLDTDTLDHYWQLHDFKNFTRSAEKYLRMHPTHFPLYRKLALAYEELGEYEMHFLSLFRYYGFIKGIMATGDGSGTQDAFIVTHINHEYEIVNHLGYVISSQDLIHEENNSYEMLLGKNEDGIKKQIFFNIQIPYSSLGHYFRNEEK